MKRAKRAIKLVDLAAQNAEIRHEVTYALARVHRDTAYVGGPEVEAFEREFAEYLNVKWVVGVSSGTEALHLALRCLGVGDGDEVITSPMTFVGTAEAIVHAGALPTFVDIDPRTGNLSPAALTAYLQSRRFRSAHGPKAILPVHLYGTPAPMAELLEIADRHGLKVVEDACQAHGARMSLPGGWTRAGAAGDAGCFSFYAGKNLGAWGEAGAIATNDSDVAERLARLRDHGRLSHYSHQECGYNARLDAIQAAVLRVKLRYLDRWNSRRREIAASYTDLLAESGLGLPEVPNYADSCHHLFVLQTRHRDHLRTALLGNQIECGIHYPVPLHLQPAFSYLGYKNGDFPHAERFADEVLSLPMHPHLANLEIVRVAEVLKRELERLSGSEVIRRLQPGFSDSSVGG